MARMRSIKPEFWHDRALACRLSRDARMLYVALWNFADEHGRLRGDPRYVKGQCLPYDDDLGLTEVADLIEELRRATKVIAYTVDDEAYLFLPKLSQHQRLESGKVPSRLPAPPETPENEPEPTEPAPRADESVPRADESGPGANESETNVAQHVAGSREHVAGSRDARADNPRGDAQPQPGATPTTRTADDLAKLWHELRPMSNYPATRKIVAKAIQVGHPPDAVTAALRRIANDKRTLTVETLRIELEGPPTRRPVDVGVGYQHDGETETTLTRVSIEDWMAGR